MTRIAWPTVVARAAEVARSYDTGITLRQLFYRLVAEQVISNTNQTYKRLSAHTAEARRNGGFPDLIDRGRDIHRLTYWASAEEAVNDALRFFRLDRTAGQDTSLYLGVEKAGMVNQLLSWFANLGIPVLALGGYSSQTYVDEVVADVMSEDRPAVLLYAGDFDPSGEDIDRDFLQRTNCWDKAIRVALTAEQVQEYGLPVNPGKVTDSRAAGFISRHGELMQVELDALDPNRLHRLYRAAIDQFWDASLFQAVLAREQKARDRLEKAARALGGAS